MIGTCRIPPHNQQDPYIPYFVKSPICQRAALTYACADCERRKAKHDQQLRCGKVLLEAERALDAPHVFSLRSAAQIGKFAHSARELPDFPKIAAAVAPRRPILSQGIRP